MDVKACHNSTDEKIAMNNATREDRCGTFQRIAFDVLNK
jgi:hypothetical protein